MLYSYGDCIKKYGNDYQITKAIKEGTLNKIESGIYSDNSVVSELAVVAFKYPNAIFTMNSAFYYHLLTDVIPEKYYLATEKDAAKIKHAQIHQYFQRRDKFGIGKTEINWLGTEITIYDKERMLIELIKNKNILPFDYYKEIIDSYRKITDKLDTEKLQDYIMCFSNQNSIFKSIQMEVY